MSLLVLFSLMEENYLHEYFLYLKHELPNRSGIKVIPKLSCGSPEESSLFIMLSQIKCIFQCHRQRFGSQSLSELTFQTLQRFLIL